MTAQTTLSARSAPVPVALILLACLGATSGICNNTAGQLSIDGDSLLFRRSDDPPSRITVASVQNVFLSQEDKQVGGAPMAVGRAAAPFGGGRAIGLLAHKKYDMVTVEYRDSNGGLHGAIFQVGKGQGQSIVDELKGNGVHVSGSTPAVAMIQSPSTLPVPAGPGGRWSVEVSEVDAGGSAIAPEFKLAIYENLLVELAHSERFSTVFRSGDRRSSGVPGLLILKTTVESYTAGSETRRAVTTVAGATKLKLRTQLCTRDGQVLLERVVDGNVRFFGTNLRATHNVARNVANAVKTTPLPEVAAVNRDQQY